MLFIVVLHVGSLQNEITGKPVRKIEAAAMLWTHALKGEKQVSCGFAAMLCTLDFKGKKKLVAEALLFLSLLLALQNKKISCLVYLSRGEGLATGKHAGYHSLRAI